MELFKTTISALARAIEPIIEARGDYITRYIDSEREYRYRNERTGEQGTLRIENPDADGIGEAVIEGALFDGIDAGAALDEQDFKQAEAEREETEAKAKQEAELIKRGNPNPPEDSE